MRAAAVVVGVLVLYTGVVQAAFSEDVPTVDEDSIIAESLVQRENGSWTLNVTVSWDRPNGTAIEGYMVKITEMFQHDDVYDLPYDGGLPIDFDMLFPIDDSLPPMAPKSEREKLEERGYVFTETEWYSYQHLKMSHDYEFEIIVLQGGHSGGDSKHKVLTADCYSSTGDREFCENQPIVFSSEPANVTLFALTCRNDTEGLSLSAVVSWLRPVQAAHGHAVLNYILRLERGGKVDKDAQFDHFVQENLTRDDLEPILFRIEALTPDESYELFITPWVNKTSSPSTPYGSKGRLPFNTNLTDQCTSWLSRNVFEERSGQRGGSVLVSVLPALVVSAVLLVGAGIVTYVCRRQREAIRTYTGLTFVPLLPKSNWKPPLAPRPEHDFGEWELSRSLLEVEGEPIGKGAFGLVLRGVAVGLDKNPLPITVAIKTLPDHPTQEQQKDFLDEIQTILDIGPHPNILAMRGCCTMSDPLYLVLEYMPYGDLLHFLWTCREPSAQKDDPTYAFEEQGVYQVARQVARGMEFLAQKKFIHGDLAARNILVGDGLVVKISDFGLSSDVYHRGYMRENMGRKIPLKWVSPERIFGGGRCTIKSDVWSYGILLYELVTLGGVPYPGMTMRQIMEKLQGGYRMERPDECSILMYDIMKRCWKWKPVDRPTFTELFNEFDNILSFDADYTRVLQALPMGDERDYANDIGAEDDVTMTKEEDAGSEQSDVTDSDENEEEEKEEKKRDGVVMETETNYLPMADRKARPISSKIPTEDKDSGYCGDVTSSPDMKEPVRYENDVNHVTEDT